MPGKGRSVGPKGRSAASKRHIRIHQWMMDCAAYKKLDPFEVRILIELYALYNGNNNGYLFLSVREASDRCNMGKNTACRCFKSLQRYGFIRRRADEPENFKLREARYWILTEFECFGRPATCDFMRWKSDKKSDRRPELNTPRPGLGTNSVVSGADKAPLSLKGDKKSEKQVGAVPEKGHSYNHHGGSKAHRNSLVPT